MPVYTVFGKNIESFKTVQRWMLKLRTKSGKDKKAFDNSTSKRNALYFLKRFCEEIANLDPDALMEQRRAQWRSDDESEKQQHEEMVEHFNLMIREEGGSIGSAQTAVGWIRSFYEYNYYGLGKLAIPSGSPTRKSTVPDVRGLAKLCEIAEDDVKAWILCQAESGIANVDLFRLTLETASPEFGTIGKQLKNEQIPLHIRIKREKTRGKGLPYYDTFFGRNAVEALNRIHLTEYLFTFSDRYIQVIIKKLGRLAGVGTEKVPVRPYSLRKFFNTQMRMGDPDNNIPPVNESQIEWWMGHTLGGSKGSYMVPPVPKQMKLYAKTYPTIDIKRFMS